jgi:3,4-dihydroxy 2-butanone 4-phosphate synthase
MSGKLERALGDLKAGKIVLIYERGERETSMVAAAEKIRPKTVRKMKEYASGDIGIVISYPLAKKFGLPFSTDVLRFAGRRFPALKELVKERSSFSLLLDHVSCKTGSSDADKLLLIRELVGMVKSRKYGRFSEVIRAPGHLKLFIASKGLLKERRGHTELSIATMKLTGMHEIAVICSMRDRETGKMLSRKKAESYAKENGLTYLESEEIVKAYRENPR